MKRIIAAALICSALVGCSTTGGIYQKGHQDNGEFSPGLTILTILGVAAGVAAARHGGGGGGGGYVSEGHAWDWQPGNRQWACRSKSTGQYAYEYQCAGEPKIDNWP